MESNSNTVINQVKEYLNDTYKFNISAKVINVKSEGNDLLIITDKTIFHPQGGGQPADEGFILNSKKDKFKVTSLTYDREKDLVTHKIVGNSNDIKEGEEVELFIDENKRMLNARLHSGGHLLDIAVSKLSLPLVPGKGYHFADGPYVEYIGKIDKTDTTLSEKLEKICNELIENSEENNKVISKIYSYEEGKKIFKIPDYIPQNKDFRWVKLLDFDEGCPCGGTHVKHIKDIKQLKISKITNKGKFVRISYNVI